MITSFFNVIAFAAPSSVGSSVEDDAISVHARVSFSLLRLGMFVDGRPFRIVGASRTTRGLVGAATMDFEPCQDDTEHMKDKKRVLLKIVVLAIVSQPVDKVSESRKALTF